jgi:tellurite resistance-related uncharacterized protein
MKKLPLHLEAYKRTPEFTQSTIPQGLLNSHSTKAGTWGKIVILKGTLIYTILEPTFEVVLLTPDNCGVVEPQMLHEVKAEEDVSFYVEFYREPSATA